MTELKVVFDISKNNKKLPKKISSAANQDPELKMGDLKKIFTELFQNKEQIAIFRTVFNAFFYIDVGFVTRRAADSILLNLRAVYLSSMESIMKVVEEEKLRVKTHLLTKCKNDIDAANVEDKVLSEELRLRRLESSKISNQHFGPSGVDTHHFDMIKQICQTDPGNTISKQIMSYTYNNVKPDKIKSE